MYRLISLNTSFAFTHHHLRQNLPAVEKTYNETTVKRLWHNSHPATSPNGRYAVFSNSNRGNAEADSSVGIFDLTNPEVTLAPNQRFPNNVYSVACSDTYFAAGGDAPYLMVWDWDTRNIVTGIDVTGIGAVTHLDFSHDGEMLVVRHTTAPYIRIYNTADWSFRNINWMNYTPAYGYFYTPGATQPLYFSRDKKTLIGLFQVSGAGVFIFDVESASFVERLGTNIFGNISSTAPLSYNFMEHPLHDNQFWIQCNNSASGNSYLPHLFNLNDKTFTRMIDLPEYNSYSVKFNLLKSEHMLLIHYRFGTLGYNYKKNKWYADRAYPGQGIEASTLLQSIMLKYNPNSYNMFILAEFDLFKVTGTVRDVGNSPARRLVRAFHRGSGELLAQTWSDSVTGDYLIRLPDGDKVDIHFYAEDGEMLNDLIQANVTPAPYPENEW